MHEVLLTPSAVKDLDALRGTELLRLRERILSLAAQPRAHGALKLEGSIHRLRAGDWRILYAIDDGKHVVTVLRVLRRNERTYRRRLH